MKKLLILTGVIITTLTLRAQETPPPFNSNFKQLSTSSFYIQLPDSAIWQFKGNVYGWARLGRFRDLKDSLANYQKKSDALLTGGVITSIPTVGFNAGSNISPTQFITNAFYQSQNPTSALSGGGTFELHSAGTFGATLNWSAGRLAATQPLSSIVVAGVSQSFTTPSAGASISGTQAVVITWNSNVTFTNSVTTVDSKSASSSTSFTFLPKRYFGRSASGTPDNTIILATAGGGSALSGSRAGTFIISASGSNFPYFAYPSNLGSLTSIKDVNNFEVLSSFNITTVSVTNASGFTQNYLVYTLNAATASNYQITTQ
jgi:hypothetical protein